MEAFRELFRMSTGLSFPMLGIEMVLIVVSIAFLFTIKEKKPFIILFFICLLPAIIGIIGTILGLNYVDSLIINNPDAYTEEMIKTGKDAAWADFKLGIILTIPAIIITGIALLFKKKKVNITSGSS
jgi:hypothetical protein